MGARSMRLLSASMVEGRLQGSGELKHQGNIIAIARATGWNRVQIRRWLERFDLDPRPIRGRCDRT